MLLQPNETDQYSNFICNACWTNIINFHQFYERIKITQKNLIETFEATVKTEDTLQIEKIDESTDNKCNTLISTSSKSIVETSEPLIIEKTDNIEDTNLKTLTIFKSELKRSHAHQLSPVVKLRKIKTATTTIKPKKEKFLSEINETILLKYFDLTCDNCFDDNNEPLQFTSTATNRQHYRIVHKVYNRYNGKCRLCSMHQTLVKKMREHIRWHNNHDEYKCRVCDKEYQSLYLLKRHELTHDNDDAIESVYFICDICGFKALTKIGLKTHMKARHISKRTYKNVGCRRKLSRKSSTNLTENSTYPCHLCDKV